MPEKKQKARASRVDWILYAKGYLGLAKIGISELLEPKHVRNKASFEYLWTHEDKLPLLAILWSMKHGLEIILKGLNIGIDGQYERHHDLKQLQTELVKALKPFGFHNDSRIGELVHLVDKYYYCKFWNRKVMQTLTIFDSKNDLFRYPENEARCSMDLSILKKIGVLEIAELQQDLNRIERIFHVVEYQVRKRKAQKS